MRDFHQSGRSPVYSVNGMAATSMPIASLTAIEVLRAGGNAVDAAVAACAVLAVVEPQSTGLGGDCFCLYAPPAAARSSPSTAQAGRRAPLRSTRSGPRAPTPPDDISPHGVTIPGAVSGWQLLLDKLWDQGLRRIAGSRHPLRRRRLSSPSARGLGLVDVRDEAAPRRQHAFPARRPPAPRGRSLRPDSARQDAALDRQARRGRLLQRTGRSRHGGDASCARRRADGGGFRQRTPYGRVRRTDLASMARARRLAVPAQRAGSGRADDSGRAGSAWDRSGRTGWRDPLPSAHRGRAHGLPRPGRFPRRSAPARDASRPPALPRLSRRAGGTYRRQALAKRPARSRRNRARGKRQYGHPFGGRPRRRRLQPHQFDLPDFRQRHPCQRVRACFCKIADCASPSSPVIPTALRPTRAPPTPSCLAWRRGTASPRSALA